MLTMKYRRGAGIRDETYKYLHSEKLRISEERLIAIQVPGLVCGTEYPYR
jgi:hypothetical protein